MTEHSELIHPTHCFCQIADAELRPWVVKRYHENLSTVELINSTKDPHQKEIISIVAMLDLDDETMLAMMGNVDLPQHHIIHCWQNVKRMLGVLDSPERKE